MSLWECIECGCKAIAHGLGFCPQCFADKPEEDAMPKITREGGPTNAMDPDAPAPEPAAEEVPADGPETAQEGSEPVKDAPVDPSTAKDALAPAPDALSELEAAAAALRRPAKDQAS